jgi:hypothetical protein
VAAALVGTVTSCGSAMLKNVDASGGNGGTSGSGDGGGMGGTDARDAAPDSGDGACVDTTSDGKNCGACGHDCLGGTCAGGKCQPVLLAQYVGNLVIISVGAQAIYATTDSGYIGRVNKDGSDVKPFARPGFASSAYNTTFIAEDGDRAFFSRFAPTLQLAYCATSGCDASVMPIGGPYTQFFAVDQLGHRIFWVDYSPSQIWTASTTGNLSGAALSGGTLATGSSGARLFYTGGGIFFADGGTISRLPAAGGLIVTVTSAASPLTVLGANATYLFVYDGMAIGYVPLPAGNAAAPKPMITTALNPGVDGHFVADATSAYWVNNGVQTCEIANCAATLKALSTRAIDIVEDVGIDNQAVYWGAGSPNPDNLSVSASTVWKLAK